MKDSAKLVFDNKITTENVIVFCVYLVREFKIGAALASISTTMSIAKAHIMTGNDDEEWMHNIALELEWFLRKD